MGIEKKTYKTKKVNIVKLSVFYNQVKESNKETKKDKNGKRNIQ